MIFSMALPKFLTASGMFKGIPPSVKPFLKPMLLISLGLHAVLLLVPLPSPPKKVELPKPKAIKITTIPALRTPPKSLVQRLNRQKLLTRNSTSLITQKGILLKSRQTKETTLTKVQSKQEAKQEAKPSSTKNEPQNNGGGSGAWSDLPTYTKNIQQPCTGIDGCTQTSDLFSEVAKYFEDNLSIKKFKFSKENTAPASFGNEYKAYKVVNKNGEAQFLSILFNGENTKYVWAPEIVSPENIVSGSAIPSDITTFIGELPADFEDASKKQLSPERFPDAAAKRFYIDTDQPDFGFNNAPADAPIIVSSSPTDAYQNLSEKLSASGYTTKAVPAGYGGGSLYEITKPGKSKPFYVTIIGTKKGDGSIVALWLSMPK
jgi:hypothetical protein